MSLFSFGKRQPSDQRREMSDKKLTRSEEFQLIADEASNGQLDTGRRTRTRGTTKARGTAKEVGKVTRRGRERTRQPSKRRAQSCRRASRGRDGSEDRRRTIQRLTVLSGGEKVISFMTASDEEKEEASGPIELTDKDEDDSEVGVVENLQQKQKGQLEKKKGKKKASTEKEVVAGEAKLRPDQRADIDKMDQEMDWELLAAIEASLKDKEVSEQAGETERAQGMTRLMQVSLRQARGRRAASKANKNLEEKFTEFKEQMTRKLTEFEERMTRNEERHKKELAEQEKKWNKDLELIRTQVEKGKRVTESTAEKEVEELKGQIKGLKREMKILQNKMDNEQEKEEGRGKVVREPQGEHQTMFQIRHQVDELVRELSHQRLVDKIMGRTRKELEGMDCRDKQTSDEQKTDDNRVHNRGSSRRDRSSNNSNRSGDSGGGSSSGEDKEDDRKVGNNSEEERKDELRRNLMVFGTTEGKRDEESVRAIMKVTGVATKEMIVRIEQLGPRRDILRVVTTGQAEADRIWEKRSDLEVIGWRLDRDRSFEERQKYKGKRANRGRVGSETRGTNRDRGDQGGGRPNRNGGRGRPERGNYRDGGWGQNRGWGGAERRDSNDGGWGQNSGWGGPARGDPRDGGWGNNRGVDGGWGNNGGGGRPGNRDGRTGGWGSNNQQGFSGSNRW